MKMLSGYKGEVEIKNKYFKFKESYYLLDNNITRIDFKYMPKSEISHWTGDYIDNADEKNPFVENEFSSFKTFFVHKFNSVLILSGLFFISLVSLLVAFSNRNRFSIWFFAVISFLLFLVDLYYTKFVAKPAYENFLSSEKKRKSEHETFLYSKRVVETTAKEPILCMTFTMGENRTHEFSFIVNNKSDADILKKELATAIFREISSIDKALTAPQVEEQENVANNRRTKNETN